MNLQLGTAKAIAVPQTSSGHSRVRLNVLFLKPARVETALAAIVALSLGLGLYNISREGYSNLFYAAAVRSMTENWHAFFFASYDSAGFVTVDKPALGLWIQALSVMIFGFHGWSILLPEALATSGSVILVFALVRRVFGPIAALIAALALTLTPINVAVSRNNTADSLLIFVLLMAAWAVARAAERGSARWFALGMVFIGLGFNIKMMQAYLVLPALVLVYLCANVIPLRTRLWHLALGAIVCLVVSFSWATAVQLTPANSRPYIGSSDDNNIFNLILGYNGINRLLPNGWSIFGITNGSSTAQGGPGGGGGVGGASENGAEGVFRLLNLEHGGQIGWLFPVAVIGLLFAWGLPLRKRFDARRCALVLWGGWLITTVTFFSVAGFYHRYYLSMVAPAIAALVGIGFVAVWRGYKRGGWRSLGLPLALVAGIWSELRILDNYPSWLGRLQPWMLATIAVSVLGLVVVRRDWLRRLPRLRATRLAPLFATVGLVGLLIAPGAWAEITVTQDAPINGTLPTAGPETGIGGLGLGGAAAPGGPNQSRDGGSDSTVPGNFIVNKGGVPAIDGTPAADPGTARRGGANQGNTLPSRSTSAAGGADRTTGAGFPGGASVATDTTVGDAMLAYLLANQGDAKWILAVPSSKSADSIIIDTGKAVMALGGFDGQDQILTVGALKTLIANGDVRFFLLSGMGMGGNRSGIASTGSGDNSYNIDQWVQSNCSTVSSSTYGGTATTSSLYDCSTATTN